MSLKTSSNAPLPCVKTLKFNPKTCSWRTASATTRPRPASAADTLPNTETDAAAQDIEAPSAASAQVDEDSVSLPPGVSLEDYLEGIERQLITQALEATRWNKTAAAKELGITFRALRYKLKKLELE